MKKEEKELLLKDLCCRLPYGVKCKIISEEGAFKLKNFLHGTSFYAFDFYIKDNMSLSFKQIEEIKPYLFPLSSMTKEQKSEYSILCYEEERECYECGEWVTRVYLHDTIESIDWLYKNNFDCRGLIPMGLAVDASGLNIY